MQASPDDFGPRTDGQARRSIDGGVARALAEGGPQRVGWFRFFFDDDRWEWSPEVQRMHGYEPGTVTPTTAQVLSHKHPDDYRQIADTLELIRQTRAALSSRHRIIDVAGQVHHVVLVGEEIRDENGEVIGTQGFYIDTTPAEQARQDQLKAQLADIAAKRATIEQAKGMLMLLYQLDADAAFELLNWQSQNENVNLRRLAEQIVDEFSHVNHNGHLPPLSKYGQLLMSAHRRIAAQTSTDSDAGRG